MLNRQPRGEEELIHLSAREYMAAGADEPFSSLPVKNHVAVIFRPAEQIAKPTSKSMAPTIFGGVVAVIHVKKNCARGSEQLLQPQQRRPAFIRFNMPQHVPEAGDDVKFPG